LKELAVKDKQQQQLQAPNKKAGFAFMQKFRDASQTRTKK
jgi:hypothetical protein